VSTGMQRVRPARPKDEPGSVAVDASAERRAPLGPTLALTLTVGIAGFALAMAAIMLNSSPTPLPWPGTFQNQGAETRSYVVGVAVLLPAALVVAPRLADRIARGPNAAGLSVLVAAAAASFAAAIIVLAVFFKDAGLSAVLGVVGAWSACAAGALARAMSRRPWAALLRVSHLEAVAWVGAGALTVGALLGFSSLASISPVAVALGAIFAVVGTIAYERHRAASRLSRPWGLAVDVSVVVLLILAVPNLVIFNAAHGAAGAALDIPVIQFHQGLWLGPINEVLAGRAILVDNASQYGIAPVYLGAAWFQLAPIGYGTFGFLDGLLFALFFAAAYGLLRVAGISRPLAAWALALAVIVLVYNLLFPVGTIPQHGPLRFGLPLVLILVSVAGARWPRYSTAAFAGQLAIVGLAAIWSLEALAYTSATYAALICFETWTIGEGRLRWLAVRVLAAVVAAVAANLALAGLTLAFTGELPDYGRYYTFLKEFLSGFESKLKFDYADWSAGLPVGIGYAASAAAFVLMVIRRPDLVASERALLTAICGVSAYGIVLYSYFVDRSENLVLPYVSLPLALIGALWLGLLLRGRVTAALRPRLAGLGFALAVSVLVIAVAWSSIGSRFEQSPLGELLPGGRSVTEDVSDLWDPPPLDPRTPEGERLLDRHMPDTERVLMVVNSALATEILMRSGRSNRLSFTDPVADGKYGTLGRDLAPFLDRDVAELEAGDLMLLQTQGLQVFRTAKQEPSRDVFSDPVSLNASQGALPGSEAPGAAQTLQPVQEWVLFRLAQRFDLQVVERTGDGFVVVRLVPAGPPVSA
jgi:hypothetical protein